MRKRIGLLLILLLLISGTSAMAEGLINASVHIRASRSVCDSMIRSGEDVDITVALDGFSPASCQWYRENERIDGANDSRLHIASAVPSDSGIYRMDAMDSAGNIRVSVDVSLRVVDYEIPKTGDIRLPHSFFVSAIAVSSMVLFVTWRKMSSSH